MKFNKIVEDIKSLKIQSAISVAKYSMLALQDYADNTKTLTKSEFLSELQKAKTILSNTRPTEPAMRNALDFVMKNLDASSLERTKEKLKYRIEHAIDHFETAEDIIAEIGSRKIKNGMKIFTHCHSTAVMSILKKAKKQKKNFEVHNTETRPLYQGRKTSLELSKEGIPIFHYIDSAARLAIKKCDLMILGADAIDSEGKAYNKIGSEMFAEIAERFDIPVYVATDSWKFDPKTIFGFNEEVEKRTGDEIWPDAPTKIKIENYAFEKVDSSLITGIISELGIFKPEMFIEELKLRYRFMF